MTRSMAMTFLYFCFGVLTTYSVENARFKDDNIQILLCLKGYASVWKPCNLDDFTGSEIMEDHKSIQKEQTVKTNVSVF